MFVHSVSSNSIYFCLSSCLPHERLLHLLGSRTELETSSVWTLCQSSCFSVLSLTMASADTLNLQSLGLSPFSGINFFYPHRHRFLNSPLCEINFHSSFEFPSSIILMSLLSFSLIFFCPCGLYLVYLFICLLLYSHFSGILEGNRDKY